MLHWLAGAKHSEAPTDPDTTGYAELPETPAPVFAVRAFKHAIFGTPQTVQPKLRRHSNTEDTRPRTNGLRPERPGLMRPKSSSDAQGFIISDDPPMPEAMASPTKGILMTPGTAATRRKTVTFGEHVTDNIEKRPSRTGLPDDCPGKFPSPWVKPTVTDGSAEGPAEKGRGRSKLTEALEQAREESAKRNRSDKRAKFGHADDLPKDLAEPTSEAGKYWKAQYDAYRENSQREAKRLIMKQKMAKSFAKDKDFQCTELADQLREEKKRVERVERRNAELEAQLLEIRAQMSSRPPNVQRSDEPVADLKTIVAAKRSHRSDVRKDAVDFGADSKNAELGQPPKEPRGRTPVSSDAPQRPTDQPKLQTELSKGRARARPTNTHNRSGDDIWNQSFELPSPEPSKLAEPPLSPNASRTVISGTGATVLKSTSNNTPPIEKPDRRDSAQPSPPNARFVREPLIRQEVLPARCDEPRKDSPTLSPGLPRTTAEARPSAAPELFHSLVSRLPTVVDAEEDISTTIPVPASSPFEPGPVYSPSLAPTKASYFDRQAQPGAGKPGSPIAKENIPPPPPSSRSAQSESVKPTAAWNAISAPITTTGKRIVSLTDKTGKEVGLDRIEAARARLAARKKSGS